MYVLLNSLTISTRSDFALWIKSFGAEVATSVNRKTTHVIANPDRKTTKVKKAARYEHIKIVNPEWMFQCCSRWEHVDETPYLIEVDPAERSGSPLEDDSINASGEEDGDDFADSPVTLNLTADNWDSVDDELADFLDGDDTDGEHASGSDSERSDDSTASISENNNNKKKRKRTNGNTTDGSETEESDSSVNSTSRLQRRKKRTMERVTSLANVVTAEKSSGLPTPEATGLEAAPAGDEEKAPPEENGVAPDLQDDYDDGLEAELLAGFDSDDGDE
jgi:RNA polymerase II subunit A-like phosphatase